MSFLFSLPDIDLGNLDSISNSPEELAKQQERLLLAFQNREADTSKIHLHKDWHLFHYLLTNDSSMEPEHRPNQPLHNLVMGGHPTSIEAAYGPARQFNKKDIEEISIALKTLTPSHLMAQFSHEHALKANLYGYSADTTEDEIEHIVEYLPKIQQLFQDALTNDEVIITYTG